MAKLDTYSGFDEDGIADWHDRVSLMHWHVKKSLQDGHPDWDAMAMGFFLGRGHSIRIANKHVDELRRRDVMPKSL